MWAKGKTATKAFARASSMGLIPSTRPGHVAYGGLSASPPAMIVLNIIEARRHLRGLSTTESAGRDERAYDWLRSRYGGVVALDMIDRFERTDGPCLSLPARKGDTSRYRLYVEPLDRGERVYLFAGAV